MKRIFSIACVVALVLVRFDPSAAASEPTARPGRTVSGDIVGGFRVLAVAESALEPDLVVYRGDYIKFKLADPAVETVLAIPALAVRQVLSGNVDEAPYFKMEQPGVFAFSLGKAEGTITVVDYHQANYREISPAEAAGLIRNITPLILDVRTPNEHRRGRLKDSVLIPLQQLQARWSEIVEYRDKDVLIYCATGNRSTVAAKILIDNGFKRIYNLRRGISGWENEKYPVVQ